MSVLSYVHQLFNVDQCQVYIHTLRWKDRPLQCPRCQSQDVDPWRNYHYRPGCKRYWCHGCKRTFNDLTDTLLHQSKRSLPHWILATFLLCLSCSSRRIARELGVHRRTSYRWCWWLRNAAVSYETDRYLTGTVEADELYHIGGHKGQAKRGGPKSLGRRPRCRRKKCEPGRGHDDKDRPAIIAWVIRQGAVVIQATRDFTVQTVQKAADIAVQAGSRLYTDSASSYRALKGYIHEFVNHTKKEYARGDVHENRAEGLFSLLKPYLRVFRGLSKYNLPGYVGFFPFLRNFRHQNACEQAEMILCAVLEALITASATLVLFGLPHGALWGTEGSRWYRNRCQDCSKHATRFLPEKPLGRSRPICTREEKVVHRCQTCPLSGVVKSSQLMIPQREIPVAPFHIGA